MTRGSRRISRRRSSAAKYLCEDLELRVLLAVHPLTDIPALHSNPGAPHTLFLSFAGDDVAVWFPQGNGTYQYQPGVIPAYDYDGDPSTFSDAELATIGSVFRIVAEKFSPFNVDVTTVDPHNFDAGKTVRMDIGGTNAWLGKGSGVSQLNGLFSSNPFDHIAFDFAQSNSNPFAVGDVAAHEAGHTFGLNHQGKIDSLNNVTQEYSDGSDSGGLGVPIMGAANLNPFSRGLWWNGPSDSRDSSNNLVYDGTQDDVAVMDGTVGPAVRAGNATQDAIPLGGGLGSYFGSGVVRANGDAEWFSFVASGGTEGFTIKPAADGPMLTPAASIRGANQNTIAVATGDSTGVTVTTTALHAGSTYWLAVGGIGSANAYTNVGSFTVASINANLSNDDANGVLHIYGSPGVDNQITVTFDSQNVTVRYAFSGMTVTQQFSVFSVDGLSFELGTGNDSVTVYPPALATTLHPPVTVDGGGGGNTLNVITNDNPHNMLMTGNQLTGAFSGPITLANIYRVSITGGAGNDTLTYGGGDVTSVPRVSFYGGGGTNSAVVDNTLTPNRWTYSVLQDAFFASNQDVYYNRSDDLVGVQNITVDSGDYDDYFSVDVQNAGVSTTLNAGGGNDTLEFGDPDPRLENPFSTNQLGPVTFNGGAGNDSILVDDSASQVARTYTLTLNQFQSDASGVISFSRDLENLEILGPSAFAGTFDVTRFGFDSVSLVGGAANDLFQFDDVDFRNITVAGAGGTNTLTVDDRTNLSGVPNALDLYADRLVREFGNVQDVIHYSGIQQGSYFENDLGEFPAGFTFNMNVYGTSSDITGQWTLVGSSYPDVVTVYPHDAAGSLTINGTIGIFGGGGGNTLTVDDSAFNQPIHYGFSNPSGSNTADISGLGSAFLGAWNDFAAIYVMAGGGDDTFDVNSFQSGNALGLFGDGGNDTLNLGNNNLPANITSISAFSFDGGPGSNSFNLNNSGGPLSWIYTSGSAGVSAAQAFPGSYFVTLGAANVQQMTINAGPSADGFSVNALNPGESLILHGGDGNDSLNLPASTAAIQGAISYFGEGGSNNQIFQLSGASGTTPIIVHLDQTSLGAFPGDTFFGPGGSLHFASLATILLTLGNGPDTAYVQPNPTAAITIRGSAPTTSPGDTLGLALAAAQNPVVHGTPTSGSVTSDNLKTLTYSGFETLEQDSVAPGVLAANINLDGAPAGAAPALSVSPADAPVNHQSLDITFSEPVALLGGTATIELTNLTTGEDVPTGYLALVYDPATQTAHYTFPGYPGGILPNGNYHGRLLAGQTADLFGNALPADVPFDFYFLAGDVNRDRAVDFADLLVLAQHYAQTGAAWSDGDLNGDGSVGFADLLILAQNYGNTVPPPVAAAASTADPLMQWVARKPRRSLAVPRTAG